MEFNVPDRRRLRTQRLPPRRGQIKIAVFKKLLHLASLAVSRNSGAAGERRPVEPRRGGGGGRASGGRRVHLVPDSVPDRRRMRTQGLTPTRGQIKIAVFKKLLHLASLAVSRNSGGGGERRPVEAHRGGGGGGAPDGRRVHPVPDSA